MATIKISNVLANLPELKSRLRGVKTPGKRILAAAFKSNDYPSLVGELLTRIDLYAELGVLNYKKADLDKIVGLKFSAGYEAVLKATLAASGLIKPKQQIIGSPVRQQVRQQSIGLSPSASTYSGILSGAVASGKLSAVDADMWNMQSNASKNAMADDIEGAIDRLKTIQNNFNDYNMEDEDGKFDDMDEVRTDFGYEMDRVYHIGFDPAVAILIAIEEYFDGDNTKNQQVITSGQNLASMKNPITDGILSQDAERLIDALNEAVENGDITNIANPFIIADDSVIEQMVVIWDQYMLETNKINGKNYRTKAMYSDARNTYAMKLSELGFPYKSCQAVLKALEIHMYKNPISVGIQKQQPRQLTVPLSPNAEQYQDLIDTAEEVGVIDGVDADMWNMQSNASKNAIATMIDNAMTQLDGSNFESVAEDFSYDVDSKFHLGTDPAIAIFSCIVQALDGVEHVG